MNCNKKDPIQARLFMLDAAAAKTTDYRPCLRHIYCDGKNIVSTNGHILVYTSNEEQLAAGFYDLCVTGTGRNKQTKFVPVMDEKAKDWQYPDWKKVVPDCTGGKTLKFHGGAAERELEIFKLQFALASMGTGALIGQEYIDLICKPQLTCDVRIADGLLPLIFEVPSFYTLLVMPCRAKAGRSEVNDLMDAYKADAVAEWKRTRDAENGRPRLTPEEAKAAAEAWTAQEQTEQPEPAAVAVPEPEAESAGNPVEPPETAPEPAADAAPMPEPVEMPRSRRKAPKDAEPAAKPKRTRKPAFAYHCELKNGRRITLDSIEAVRARRDVRACRIEPVKKSRKAA